MMHLHKSTLAFLFASLGPNRHANACLRRVEPLIWLFLPAEFVDLCRIEDGHVTAALLAPAAHAPMLAEPAAAALLAGAALPPMLADAAAAALLAQGAPPPVLADTAAAALLVHHAHTLYTRSGGATRLYRSTTRALPYYTQISTANTARLSTVLLSLFAPLISPSPTPPSPFFCVVFVHLYF